MRGHIRKRGKSWAVVIDVGRDEGGRRRQRWHGGYPTRKAAQEALTGLLGRVQRGEYVEPSKRMLAVFLAEWLDSMRATVRPSTWAAYKMLAEVHIIPALGTVPLQRLTAAQLNALYADLLAGGRCDGKGGLSPRTVRYVHVTLHRALGEAVKWGLLTRNVADASTPPRQTKGRELRVWSAEELRAFLEATRSDFYHALLYLASMTGMRRGEVLGLSWGSLDLAGGRLSVSRTLIAVKGQPTFSTPKTAKGRRSVALDPATVGVLRAHRTRVLEDRLILGLGAPRADDLVFTAPDGGPVDPEGFSDHFLRLVKAAGLPRIRFHDLRHTHATVCLQAGLHPKVVSERLGHASVSITLDTYSHAIPAMQEEAAAKVAALVFGG